MARLPDLGTPPTAEPNVSAADRATDLLDDAPTPTPATTPATTPAAEPPKRKRGQRGPDKAPRARKKATPADFQAARAADHKAPSLVAPLPPAPLSPDAVARLARGLAQLAGMCGNLAGAAYGDHCKLAPEESQALGEAWADILAPYMGDGAGASLKYITAGAVTLGVILPRVKATKEKRAAGRALGSAEPTEVVVTDTAAGPIYSGPVLDSAKQ